MTVSCGYRNRRASHITVRRCATERARCRIKMQPAWQTGRTQRQTVTPIDIGKGVRRQSETQSRVFINLLADDGMRHHRRVVGACNFYIDDLTGAVQSVNRKVLSQIITCRQGLNLRMSIVQCIMPMALTIDRKSTVMTCGLSLWHKGCLTKICILDI